jgi:hypothetical protein
MIILEKRIKKMKETNVRRGIPLSSGRRDCDGDQDDATSFSIVPKSFGGKSCGPASAYESQRFKRLCSFAPQTINDGLLFLHTCRHLRLHDDDILT